MSLATVYICPNCGDVTDVQEIEHIDTERDDVFTELHCVKCLSSVKNKITNGIQELKEVEDFFDSITPEEY